MTSAKPDPADIDFSTVTWEKSPYSGGNNNCVEFGDLGEHVAIRDSQRTEQTPLIYTRGEIRALLLGVKAGYFDHLA
ncbi:DUF397 domain-containing protein [Kitasatospora aureofaciens]|uniref:DUF397 domain-containing protein n=1 Tax=Kitasatospora aureofaciens TaxID=1894 RepID=UPI0006907279|nr:DUF397 domain-containing protein [Kitasatospora aureofaciens]